MIVEMTTALMMSCSPAGTRGASELAAFVDRQSIAGRRSLQNSFYFGNLQKVFNDLFTVAEDCKSANWDGQGAQPVSEESYRTAFGFLEALPLGAVTPSVGVEPDGEITLEWYHSLRHTLSISFSKTGELHYAALIGASKTYGTEPFYGEVPKIIANLIARITGA